MELLYDIKETLRLELTKISINTVVKGRERHAVIRNPAKSGEREWKGDLMAISIDGDSDGGRNGRVSSERSECVRVPLSAASSFCGRSSQNNRHITPIHS